MCGLIGYYCFGDKRPNYESVKQMFISCQSRGDDATGFAYISNDKLYVRKDGVPAIKFVESASFKELKGSMPKILTGHCRAGTAGSETDNLNNHPVFSKMGSAICHNGIVSNEDHLFKKNHFVRDGKVDSEIIVRLFDDKLDKGLVEAVQNLSCLSGSLAVSIITKAYPDKLILAKHSNPIVFAIDKKDDIVYYASTKEIVQDGFTGWYRGFSISNKKLSFSSMDDNYAMVIDRDGVSEYFEFYDFKKIDHEVTTYNATTYGGRGSYQSSLGWKSDKEYEKKYGNAYRECDKCHNWYPSSEMWNGQCTQCLSGYVEI